MIRLGGYALALLALLATVTAPAAKDKSEPAEEQASEADTDWPTMDEVKAKFASQFADECSRAFEMPEIIPETEVYELSYRYRYEEPDSPPHRLQLYRFYCTSGAYNVQDVYYSVVEYDGARPIAFAEPVVEATYPNGKHIPDDDEQVERLAITGFIGRHTLTNSSFDEKTHTISSNSYWRGLGDASSHGEYRLEDDLFVLKRFDVDASYDGEVSLMTVFQAPDTAD